MIEKLPAGAALVVALRLLAPAAAFGNEGTVQVALHDGLVSIVAREAPVSDILAEWARTGGMTIVNVDKLRTPPVTIELTNVPEQRALDVLMRSFSGYVAVPRATPAPNASRFSRIVVMWTKAAPAAPSPVPSPAPAPTASSAANVPSIQSPASTQPPTAVATSTTGVVRLLDANGQPIPDDQDGAPPPRVVAAPPGFTRGDPPIAAPVPGTPAAQPRPLGNPAPAPVVIGTKTPGIVVPSAPPAQESTRTPTQR